MQTASYRSFAARTAWDCARRVAIGLAAVALAGCATRAPDVSVWSLQSPHLGLPTATTYGLGQPTGPIHDSTSVWAPPAIDLEAAIRPLVEAELADRGHTTATGGTAPWTSASYEILADEAQVERAEGRLGELETAKPIGVGTLLVDVDDPASGRVPWRGAAVGGVNATRSVEPIDERLRYALAEIFSGFPE